MSLKNYFYDRVFAPAAESRGGITYKHAIIKKTDEPNNMCSITYVDKDGRKRNVDNVPVKIYTPGLLDWFPEKGEIVSIEEVDGFPIVSGVPMEGYTGNVRESAALEADYLSDTLTGDTTGGYIF